MARVLKFRAWDARGKSWLIPYPRAGFCLFGETTCFDLIGQQMHERYPAESTLLLMNEVEVTEFTGLKDKNGADVYEGDIVEFRSEWNVFIEIDDKDAPAVMQTPVVFERGMFCFNGQYGYEGKEIDFDQVIVVGNIYENPSPNPLAKTP